MMFLSAGIAAAAGVLSLLCCRRGGLSGVVGPAGTFLSVIAGIVGLCTSPPPGVSLLFMLPTLILAPAAAVHSVAYIKGHGNPGVYWGFFNLTVATMLALPLIKDFLEFLIVWELMGIFSFVLVMFNYKAEELKRVAWIYLLACEAGGLLLMLFYALSFKTGAPRELFYIAGVAGFGLKAGFPLLHLWLPEAHPAAPAPVSAIMSGAMINLGIFGILIFVFPGMDAKLCGWTLLLLGCISSLGGIIFALAQDNLKRLLAYSSIENIGIISISAGCAFLGGAFNNNNMIVFGILGTVLHILNHALLKGTLFLGAGQVYCSSGTLSIDRMGGMMKTTPLTGSCFTAAAAGLSGLPPFNGFIGELMIYLAAFSGICSGVWQLRFAGIAAALILSLTGACAVAAFAKAIGGTFLGEPRKIADCKKESAWMYAPMLFLLLLSLLVVFTAPFTVPCIFKAINISTIDYAGTGVQRILFYAASFSAIFYILSALILLIRRFLLAGWIPLCCRSPACRRLSEWRQSSPRWRFCRWNR